MSTPELDRLRAEAARAAEYLQAVEQFPPFWGAGVGRTCRLVEALAWWRQTENAAGTALGQALRERPEGAPCTR